MRYRNFFLFRIVLLLMLGLTYSCTLPVRETTEKSQLQIREFQTRTFEESDLRLVMKSVLNVLQDDGFNIKNATLDLGFISANKDVDVEESGERIFSQMFMGQEARWDKQRVIEATINVTIVGSQTRVRANFQSKLLDNIGNLIRVQQIDDPKFYQDFFMKVDKGIFLQKNNL